jgi:hypothetical protein
MALAGTPQPLIERLHKEILTAVGSRETGTALVNTRR